MRQPLLSTPALRDLDLERRVGLRQLGGANLDAVLELIEGNVPVPEREEKIGLNVYRKK